MKEQDLQDTQKSACLSAGACCWLNWLNSESCFVFSLRHSFSVHRVKGRAAVNCAFGVWSVFLGTSVWFHQDGQPDQGSTILSHDPTGEQPQHPALLQYSSVLLSFYLIFTLSMTHFLEEVFFLVWPFLTFLPTLSPVTTLPTAPRVQAGRPAS